MRSFVLHMVRVSHYSLPSCFTNSCLARVTERSKVTVPWLLLAKSPSEYLDMECVPEGFVVTDPSKFTKMVLDCLWAHWERRAAADKPIVQFLKARSDDLPFGLPKVERHPCRRKCIPTTMMRNKHSNDHLRLLFLYKQECRQRSQDTAET